MCQKRRIHQSYWLNHVSKHLSKSVRLETLTSDHHSQVAIVGAGITGLSTALELLKRGYSVAVYESLVIGAGTTSGSTGHLDSHPETSATKLLTKLGIQAGREYIAQRQRAIDVIEERATVHCDFVRLPAIQYSEDAADEDEMRREFESAMTMGLDVNWLEHATGPFVRTGYRVNRMGRIHSFEYQLRLAELVLQQGGRIFHETRVLFPTDPKPGSMKAGEHSATFEHLICAVHSNYTDAMRIDLQLAPYQSYAIVATVADPIPDQLMWDNATPYFYTRRVDSLDPSKILVGGCDHRTGTGDPAAAISELEDYIRAHYQVRGIEKRWSAEFFEPLDGLPLIGQVPGKEHVWIATGFSGVGLTQGTAAGWLIAEMIAGEENSLHEMFSPARFSVGGNLGTLVSEQSAAVANYAQRVLPAEELDPQSLAPGEGDVGMVDGQHSAACRDANGDVHVRSAICQHMGGVVRWNPFEKTWDCPVHGGRYAACGKRLYGPPESDLAD